MINVAFTGKNVGGLRMRGVRVAERLGVPFINVRDLKASDSFDTIVLVKYWHDPKVLRRCCRRLIFDPLDCWESTKPRAEPADFWRWTHKLLNYDEIIATSPACLNSMACLIEHKTIAHMLPHHADPRVGPDWYDPDGPVVYAGGRRFIDSALISIGAACTRLGRRLLLDYNKDCWRRLQGAALCLHLRLPPHDTPLNRLCKPQVKLENAAAAGLPCLATPDPCVITLDKPDISCTLCADETQRINWKRKIEDAINRPQLSNPVTLEQHADRMAEILGI